MLKCPICEIELSKIDKQHLKKHNLSKEEYFERFGSDAPFGYSEELKLKKSGKNHPLYNKGHSEETKNKLAETTKKIWEEGRASDKQKNSIGQRSKNAAKNGNHFNIGKIHERSDEYRNKLSIALKNYYKIHKRNINYELWHSSIKHKIAKTRKFNTFIKFSKNLESWAILYKIENSNAFLTCNKCNSTIIVQSQTIRKHNYESTLCHKCFPIFRGSSKLEQEVLYYLENDLNINVIQHNRTILSGGLELDFFIQDKNIAIEFNGLYWHSDLANYDSGRHLLKHELCEQQNIMLIQIFEHEWINKQDLVKGRLKSKLGLGKKIPARKCIIKEISFLEKKLFLDNNHIQGDAISAFQYGLFYQETLVAVMTFSKPRFSKKYDFELIRFASLNGVNIIGGASKLFAAFIRRFPNSTIVSYADRRWNSGKIYEILGLNLVGISGKNYWYFKGLDVWHRTNFQKHKLKNKLQFFDENLTEWENMKNNGYNKFWDCGNLVYEFLPK